MLKHHLTKDRRFDDRLDIHLTGLTQLLF